MYTICRTPLRVSLFGGGTDYPSYFHRMPGSVLGFAIDKYIYVAALRLTAFVDYKFRLSYSRVETVERSVDLVHPMVRALIEHYRFDDPVDLSIQADLPASSGLGSSSAFTVGMINTLSAMMGVERTKFEIAREAIHAEQVLLSENVGVQDQLHATFGGINRFNFSGDGFNIMPLRISGREMRLLTDWMVLVFTGIKRRATSVVQEQVSNTRTGEIDRQLGAMMDIVDEAQRLLESGCDEDTIRELASLLDRSWQLKKSLASSVSAGPIDELYEFCLANGALGGKLCGAGSGGFLLMIVPPDKRRDFDAAVGARNCIDFAIDVAGTTIIHRSVNGNG